MATTGAAEENKASVRRSIAEVLNNNNLSVMDQFYADDVIVHSPGHPAPLHGRDELKGIFTMVHSAFPDSHFDLQDIIAEDDRVVVRWIISGTHRGEYLGFPPGGKRASWQEVVILRFAGGKAQELWLMPDVMGSLQKLGLVPSGPPPKLLMKLLGFVERLRKRSPQPPPPPPAPVADTVWTPPAGAQPSTAAASTEEYKAFIYEGIEEMWQRKNLAAMGRYFATDVVAHSPIHPRPLRGHQETAELFELIQTAFPDCTVEINDMIGEGDKVAVRWTIRGTHTGEYVGFPPTGRRVAWREVVIYRFADGKAQELWLMPNVAGVMQQIGAVPDEPLPPPVVRLMNGLQRLTSRGT